jgi:hypothetical protein
MSGPLPRRYHPTRSPSVETWKPKGKKVSPRAKPTVTFSEATDAGSVEAAGTFTLKKGTTVLLASVEYVEDSQSGPYKAIQKPTRPLKPGATYTATVTAAATDAAGNALVAKTWTFKVKR